MSIKRKGKRIQKIVQNNWLVISPSLASWSKNWKLRVALIAEHSSNRPNVWSYRAEQAVDEGAIGEKLIVVLFLLVRINVINVNVTEICTQILKASIVRQYQEEVVGVLLFLLHQIINCKFWQTSSAIIRYKRPIRMHCEPVGGGAPPWWATLR